MNNEFGKTLALLRKQRGLSQKKTAEDLGVSQALLSHYEKGIRECSLSFLVKTAEYFDVTTDYLLGVSNSPYPNIIEASESQTEFSQKKVTNTYYLINKKLIIDTVSIIYDIISEIDSKRLNRYVSDYIMTSLYTVFRKIYSLNKNNPTSAFDIKTAYSQYSDASMKLDLAKISKLKAEQKDKLKIDLSPEKISMEYRDKFSSFSGLIRNTEKNINSKFKI